MKFSRVDVFCSTRERILAERAPRHEYQYVSSEKNWDDVPVLMRRYRELFNAKELFYYCFTQTDFDSETKQTTVTVLEQAWHDPPELLEINTQAKEKPTARKKTILKQISPLQYNIQLEPAPQAIE